jgi:hypothetical protein
MKFLTLIFILFPLAGMTQNWSLIESLEGTSSHVNGPNCWNGALVVAGVLEHKRMLHPDEWLYHLDNSCVEIQAPRPGDVGRIYHDKDGEVHGFIHLNDDLIFAKHAEQSQYGFQTMSYTEMMDQYGKTRNCKIRRDESPECFHKVKYYRCSKQAELTDSILEINALFETLTFSEETRWRFRMDCEHEVHHNRERIYNQMREIISEMDINGLDEQFLRSLVFSYSEQLHRMSVSDRNFTCRPRELREERNRAQRALSKEIRSLVN